MQQQTSSAPVTPPTADHIRFEKMVQTLIQATDPELKVQAESAQAEKA